MKNSRSRDYKIENRKLKSEGSTHSQLFRASYNLNLNLILTYLAFPTIVSEVSQEFGVLISEVNPGHVWDAEICDQDASYAANSGNDECPPSEK